MHLFLLADVPYKLLAIHCAKDAVYSCLTHLLDIIPAPKLPVLSVPRFCLERLYAECARSAQPFWVTISPFRSQHPLSGVNIPVPTIPRQPAC